MKKLLSVLLAISLVMSLAMFASAAVGDSYDALAELDTEVADGAPWQYMFTLDGSTYEYLAVFAYDAWRAVEGDVWAGVGTNVNEAVPAGTLEFNTGHGGAHIGVLAFVAPNAGSYQIEAFTAHADFWEEARSTEAVHVYHGSTKLYEGTFGDAETLSVPDIFADMAAGDKIYVYFTEDGNGSISGYANIVITEIDATDVPTPVETPADETEPGDVLPIAMVVISAVTAGGALIARKRR